MSDLYRTALPKWAEQQTALLRRAEAGERVDGIDWPNIIHEIENAGQNEQHAVETLLTASFLCMLKAEGWPLSQEAPVWQAEARRLGSQATRQLTPAMRQQIDLRKIYADALAVRPTSIEGQPPRPVSARWRRLSTKTPITH